MLPWTTRAITPPSRHDGHQHHTGPIIDPSTTLVDPLVALGACAAATSRIRLATGVFIVTLRHPLLTARMTLTVQDLAGGRFMLGVGSGWLREEFEALDVPFEGAPGAWTRRSPSCAGRGAARSSPTTAPVRIRHRPGHAQAGRHPAHPGREHRAAPCAAPPPSATDGSVRARRRWTTPAACVTACSRCGPANGQPAFPVYVRVDTPDAESSRATTLRASSTSWSGRTSCGRLTEISMTSTTPSSLPPEPSGCSPTERALMASGTTSHPMAHRRPAVEPPVPAPTPSLQGRDVTGAHLLVDRREPRT